MVSVREVDSVGDEPVGFEDPGTSAQTLIASTIKSEKLQKLNLSSIFFAGVSVPAGPKSSNFGKKPIIGDDQGLELENLRAR